MALYDQHVHCRYSMDSEAAPIEVVGRAVKMGLAGVTFTDHYDSHPSEWHKCVYDYDRLAETVSNLRAELGERFFIGLGIEICYQPEQMEKILAYLDAHEFDVVMLSVHWFAGRALHEREHWQGLDTESATKAYLETVLEAARFVGELNSQGQRPFDVLGHLDLVKRYTQRYFNRHDVRQHADLVDEILRACLAADLIPELNLSSWRQGIDQPMPPDWVVGRYAQLGGQAMSLGSDAHKAEQVGLGLAEGAAMLKQQGIRHSAIFKGRKRHDEPL